MHIPWHILKYILCKYKNSRNLMENEIECYVEKYFVYLQQR